MKLKRKITKLKKTKKWSKETIEKLKKEGDEIREAMDIVVNNMKKLTKEDLKKIIR